MLLTANSSTEVDRSVDLTNGRASEPAPATVAPVEQPATAASSIPNYLTKHYWWAYVHPKAVWFFERQWLIDAHSLGQL